MIYLPVTVYAGYDRLVQNTQITIVDDPVSEKESPKDFKENVNLCSPTVMYLRAVLFLILQDNERIGDKVNREKDKQKSGLDCELVNYVHVVTARFNFD